MFLQKCFCYTPKCHREIRELISKVFRDNIDDLCQFKEKVEILKDLFINTYDYIQTMSEDGNWVATIDISVIVYIYNINIAFYLFDEINNNLNYAHLFSYDENNEQIPLLILKNSNFNHFEV